MKIDLTRLNELELDDPNALPRLCDGLDDIGLAYTLELTMKDGSIKSGSVYQQSHQQRENNILRMCDDGHPVDVQLQDVVTAVIDPG